MLTSDHCLQVVLQLGACCSVDGITDRVSVGEALTTWVDHSSHAQQRQVTIPGRRGGEVNGERREEGEGRGWEVLKGRRHC